MREICLSGSMSGNRNQNQVKPDCGDEAKANSIIHRETTVTAPVLDSTRDFTKNPHGETPSSHPVMLVAPFFGIFPALCVPRGASLFDAALAFRSLATPNRRL